MRKSLLFGVAFNFIGACYTIGLVVQGNILDPSRETEEASSLACAFLLGFVMGLVMYCDLKPIKKAGS